jgi:hypothetical protein
MPAVRRTLGARLMRVASAGYEELMDDGIHSLLIAREFTAGA